MFHRNSQNHAERLIVSNFEQRRGEASSILLPYFWR